VVEGGELREVMGRFPTGAAVVAVDVDGQRVGLTVSAVVTLSLEPPLVGVAVARHAALHELLREAGHFGVSLLAAGQERVAGHFARGVPPIAMWQGVDVLPGEGPPLLAGAAGWLTADVEAEVAAGTHTLFVGRVATAAPGGAPQSLVRVRGGWAAA
jgi:flavin reductase (DIM6/NTAB) family NADH-FMN oxidoreductase RutF